ncbi:putative RNA-directed DNA polymerase, partial [Tanacetum coccineum]
KFGIANVFLSLCEMGEGFWQYVARGKSNFKGQSLIKNQFGKSVKTFRSDNGTEFVNKVFNKFCIENGIIHQTTFVYTPQQNGIVERKHRHLLNVARSLLFQGGLPLYLWSECIMTAAYLINMLPSSVLNGKTPFELVFNKKPILKHLRVFGCLCYATVLNIHDKLGSRAEKCVLVGYASFKKGYKLYSLERKQFIYSRDVRFFEKVFPFKIRQLKDTNLTSQGLDHVNFFNEIVHANLDTSCNNTSNPASSQSDGSHPSHPDNSTIDPFENELGHSQGSNGFADADEEAATFVEHNAVSEDDIVAAETVPESVPTTSLPNVRRSERTSVFPNKYKDFVVESKVKYGLENYVSYVNLSTENKCFTTELNKSLEPKSFYEASKDQHWIEAMNNEMDASYRNDTWEVVEFPVGRKAIGYNQKEGIDFDETFSPVLKIVTIMCVINLAVQNNWFIYQLDVNNAFLYGDLDETVYMSLPEGFFNPGDKRVCRLKNSLYGLKQAPR